MTPVQPHLVVVDVEAWSEVGTWPTKLPTGSCTAEIGRKFLALLEQTPAFLVRLTPSGGLDLALAQAVGHDRSVC